MTHGIKREQHKEEEQRFVIGGKEEKRRGKDGKIEGCAPCYVAVKLHLYKMVEHDERTQKSEVRNQHAGEKNIGMNM